MFGAPSGGPRPGSPRYTSPRMPTRRPGSSGRPRPMSPRAALSTRGSSAFRGAGGRPRTGDPTGKIRAAAAILQQKGGGETARLVQNATRIGTPRLIHEDEVPYTTIKKKVVREVEVPFMRKVKVPTKTKKIVPGKTTVRVKTERLQPVTVMKQVKEEYTAMVPKKVTRDKVVWVKKVVKETVTEMVPVKKYRMIDVPKVEYQKVSGYEDVVVTKDQLVEVEGFRVDEVQDRKLIEVEETEEYELAPTKKIDEFVHDVHDRGKKPRMPGERRPKGRVRGAQTFERHEVVSVDSDSETDSEDEE